MLALANKLTISTQPIYRFVNKYSIDFDGVDDRIITDGADTVAQPTTYSFWCKSSEISANRGVFGHGGDNIGAFHFNWSADRPMLYLGNSYYQLWADTSAQDDGEWHHWVVYSDPNDITNSKLYVDSVLIKYPGFSWRHDKMVEDGCSKRRPDLFLDVGSSSVKLDTNSILSSGYQSYKNFDVLMLSSARGFSHFLRRDNFKAEDWQTLLTEAQVRAQTA